MKPEEAEFYVAAIIYGAIGFIGLLVVIVITAFAFKVRGNLNKKTIIKDLYGQKERTNGQHKGGARGTY